METAILLVLLTLNPAGQPGVNFVASDDMDTCTGKTILLKNILTSGGVKIVDIRCVPSKLQFGKYMHRPSKEKHAKPAKRHTYLVNLGENSVDVTPMGDMTDCEGKKAAMSPQAGRKLYCATSVQAMK